MGRNFWNVFWEVLKSSVTLGTPEPHHAVGELAPRGLSDLKEPPVNGAILLGRCHFIQAHGPQSSFLHRLLSWAR